MFLDFGLVESAVAAQMMVPVFEDRARLRREAAERDRAMLAAMTQEERSLYWESRKVKALEAQASASRELADATRSAWNKSRSSGPGFGMGVILGALIGKGSE